MLLGKLIILGGISLSFFFVWFNKLTLYRLTVSLLVCSILLPGIPIPGYFVLRPEELLVIIIFPFLLSHLKWHWCKLDIFFALIAVSVLISLLLGNIQGIPFAARDLMEFVKLVKYWLFFHLVFRPWQEEQIKGIMYWVVVCMAIAAFIGVVQSQNWLGIGSFLRQLYGQDSVHVVKSDRVIGTMRNPNDFALILVTGFSVSISVFRFYKRKFFLAVMVLLILVGVFLTLSRSGILAVAIVAIVVFIGKSLILKRAFLEKLFILLILGSFVVIILAIVVVPILIREYETIQGLDLPARVEYTHQSVWHAVFYRFSVINETGLPARINRWQEHLRAFYQSPIWGLGPGKSSYTSVVDSEYVLYLRRYGIVGLGLLMGLYLHILRFCWRGFFKFGNRSLRGVLGLCVIAIVFAYLAVNFFITTFYLLQLMSVFWILVGIAFSGFLWPNLEKIRC